MGVWVGIRWEWWDAKSGPMTGSCSGPGSCGGFGGGGRKAAGLSCKKVRMPPFLYCYWVGSLDLNFLGHQGVFHSAHKSEAFCRASTATNNSAFKTIVKYPQHPSHWFLDSTWDCVRGKGQPYPTGCTSSRPKFLD